MPDKITHKYHKNVSDFILAGRDGIWYNNSKHNRGVIVFDFTEEVH